MFDVSDNICTTMSKIDHVLKKITTGSKKKENLVVELTNFIDSLIHRQIAFVQKLSGKKYDIIHKYVENCEINNKLRQSLKLNKEEQELYKTLMECFEEIPSLDHDIVVFRGTDRKIAIEEFSKSFISTSSNILLPKEFGYTNTSCCIYQILIKKNTKILPLCCKESEILIPPNVTWKLVKKLDSFPNNITRYFLKAKG